MFYISYYSNKDKKNIIRRGKIDKKCRLDTNKQGKPYFVYFDIDKNKDLISLDDDLRELFRSWFNPGFLKLAKITWDTKAAVLEKIMKYERVHEIKDMDELKRRLGEDRRFFAYFHPALEDEPIIFVQVALTNGLGKSISFALATIEKVNEKIENIFVIKFIFFSTIN